MERRRSVVCTSLIVIIKLYVSSFEIEIEEWRREKGERRLNAEHSSSQLTVVTGF